jgi:hypothetical protein
MCVLQQSASKRGLPVRKSTKGQSLVEYVLMTALLSTLTFGFVKFFGQSVFRDGLKELPKKAASCLSHPKSASDNGC